VSQSQAEQAVVGSQGGLVMPLGDAGSDPLVAAAAKGALRTGVVGDALTCN
jgi:hypothetical protein